MRSQQNKAGKLHTIEGAESRKEKSKRRQYVVGQRLLSSLRVLLPQPLLPSTVGCCRQIAMLNACSRFQSSTQ